MIQKKYIANVDPTGTFNSWVHIVFDEKRWLELVENLGSNQAEWDDTDWKDEENIENANRNRPPFVITPSNYSSESPSPIFNLDLSHRFEILENFLPQKVKRVYQKLTRLLHPDTGKSYKSFTREEGSEQFKYVSNVYEALMESNTLLQFPKKGSIYTSIYL